MTIIKDVERIVNEFVLASKPIGYVFIYKITFLGVTDLF
jgi:hypothetical protein